MTIVIQNIYTYVLLLKFTKNEFRKILIFLLTNVIIYFLTDKYSNDHKTNYKDFGIRNWLTKRNIKYM